MKPGDRQKMCTQCEGRISFDALECPYCTAEQAPPASDQPSLFNNQTLQSSLASLYTPPYSSKTTASQEPVRKVSETYKEAPVVKAPALPVSEQEEVIAQNHFWPQMTLSAGALFLVLGLLQLFFSSQGKLRLEWNSNYWFLYCLVAAPLLFFGFKRVNQIK